jgi:ABC-type transporter Mla maintaining outer membrane lipid asymmetry permease subunit MlaE
LPSPSNLDLLFAGYVICGLTGAALKLYHQYQNNPEYFTQSLMPTIAINCICMGYPVMRLVAAIGMFVSWRDGLYPYVETKAKGVMMWWGEKILEVHVDDQSAD